MELLPPIVVQPVSTVPSVRFEKLSAMLVNFFDHPFRRPNGYCSHVIRLRRHLPKNSNWKKKSNKIIYKLIHKDLGN